MGPQLNLDQAVILLAEDEPVVRNFVRTLLVASGYYVIDAADGRQAVELSQKYSGNIDLFLTDVKMPNLNGDEAANIIKEQRPEIGLLFMSGYNTGETHAQFHGNHFIRKPFHPQNLRDRIRIILEESQKR